MTGIKLMLKKINIEKKLLRRIFYAPAAAAVLLVICNTECKTTVNSPRKVLIHVMKQAQKDNLKEAYQYVTPDLYNIMQNLRWEGVIGAYNSKQKKKITEAINGDQAYVSVFFENENNPVVFYFRIIDGKWKIAAQFEKNDNSIALTDIIPYIEDGDIILSGEDDISSYYIRSLSSVDKRFSHSGIIYKKNGIISVVGAEGMENKYNKERSGVMDKPIEEYLQNKSNIGIYRAKRNNRKAYSAKAMEYLGVPFDFKFTLDNEDELYCTQFIQVVLRETNTPVKLRLTYVKQESKDIILPDSISSSDDFEEIRYIEKRGKV